MGIVLKLQFLSITIECVGITVKAQAQKAYHLRSVYIERDCGLVAFAKEWSK